MKKNYHMEIEELFANYDIVVKVVIQKNYEERRGKIQISNLITDRPAPANNRERLGDWEADTLMGQTGKACLVTLTDRKSRYLLCKKLQKECIFSQTSDD